MDLKMSEVVDEEPSKKSTDADRESVKVCVVGLGKVGHPTASHIDECGFSVCGYDIDKEKTIGTNPFYAFSDWSEAPECDIYVVCVSTGWKNGKPDMSSIFDVCNKISLIRDNKPLVCIESTVSVGTCRMIAEMFEDVYLAHVPHRFWSEEPKRHGVQQLRIIGALNHQSLVKARDFYDALGIPLHLVSSLEAAEMTKIAENAYRFMQIAFVEQLNLLCVQNGIPFDEVRSGANTKWNVSLLEARKGIEGDCLPKDIKYLASLGEAPLLKSAVEVDKCYKDHKQKDKGLLDLKSYAT